MNLDKGYRTEISRTFLIEALPEPLTPRSEHLQLFDNYIHETRIRLRSERVPETKEWTHTLQQRVPDGPSRLKIAEIQLNELEYEHFKIFEGNEIRKNRYFYKFDGREFVLDIYLGPLWGLNRATVEFKSAEESARFEPPPWAILEITDDPFFADESLVAKKFEEIQLRVRDLSRTALPREISL
jgi:CYTH domain-containing protein